MIESESPLHDFALFIVQLIEPLLNQRLQIVALQNFFRIGRALIGDGVEQGTIRVVVQRRVHRGDAFIQAQHPFDVFDRFVEKIGDFFRRRFMVELLRQVACRALVNVDFFQNVDRQEYAYTKAYKTPDSYDKDEYFRMARHPERVRFAADIEI